MKDHKGITLIELLVAFAISSLLVAVFFKVFITQAKTYEYEDKVLELSQSLNAAVDVMIQDAKMTGYDSIHPGSQVIITNAASIAPETFTIKFEQDNTTMRTVTYYMSGSSLVKRQTDTNVASGSSTTYNETILDGIESLQFSSIMNGARLVGVGIAITVKADDYRRTTTTQIALRN